MLDFNAKPAPAAGPHGGAVFVVTGTERLSPTLQRVAFEIRGVPAEEVGEFTASPDTDMYVKLIFPAPEGLTAEELEANSPGEDEDAIVMRTYTLHSVAVDGARITGVIDFVAHGGGLAGPWALAAAEGDWLEVFGPGGNYAPDAGAARHLLAGDAAALPAIAAAMRAMPAEAVGDVVLETPHPSDMGLLPEHPGLRVRHVTPWETPGDALVAAVRQVHVEPEGLQVFIHGEAHAVMKKIRPWLKGLGGTVRGASISGYWRQGRSEEGFRLWKRDNRPED